MIPKPGQRWHWLYSGSTVNCDLIVEIVEDSFSSNFRGKCLQVISSNDPLDVIGFVQNLLIHKSLATDAYDVIIDGHSKLIYLSGQDAPQ